MRGWGWVVCGQMTDEVSRRESNRAEEATFAVAKDTHLVHTRESTVQDRDGDNQEVHLNRHPAQRKGNK